MLSSLTFYNIIIIIPLSLSLSLSLSLFTTMMILFFVKVCAFVQSMCIIFIGSHCFGLSINI